MAPAHAQMNALRTAQSNAPEMACKPAEIMILIHAWNGRQWLTAPAAKFAAMVHA